MAVSFVSYWGKNDHEISGVLCTVTRSREISQQKVLMPVPFSKWFNFNPKHAKVITVIIKCGMKLPIQSHTSAVALLKFGNGWTISSHTLYWVCDDLPMLELKLIHENFNYLRHVSFNDWKIPTYCYNSWNKFSLTKVNSTYHLPAAWEVSCCCVGSADDVTSVISKDKGVQGLWEQHVAYLGPTGPRWAPCWPHEPCYLGCIRDS